MRKPNIIRKWAEVEWNGEPVDAEVAFTVSPIIPATYLQPAEGGEVEIQRVLIDDGRDDILDRLDATTIDALAVEMFADLALSDFDYGPDPDDLRDQRIDARLTEQRP
ncbi:hypothetical protein [Sphingopyxis sp. NJF-3]